MTQIGQWLSEAEATLIQAGLDDTPQLDAQLLIQAVLDVSASYLVAWPDKLLEADAKTQLDRLLARRLAGEPVAYILGHQPFWTLDLRVTDATLIPRPDTEHLVEAVLDRYADHEQLSLIDLGTGTGAIGLSLKKEQPGWQVMVSDYSLAAATVAKGNAQSAKLNVPVWCGSWLAAVASDSMDVIVSNPPYIHPDDPHLKALQYEPHSALVSGHDGLVDIRDIVAQAVRCLKPGGGLFIEHGYDQGPAVRAIFEAQGFVDVATNKDYGDNDRFTYGFIGAKHE